MVLSNILQISSSIQRYCCQTSAIRSMATAKLPIEEDDEKPMKYFGSSAASWKARQGNSGGADDVVWYQPVVISASLAIFLLYFCVFREENDIDRKLEGSLYDHVSGLEEQQLELVYNYNLKNGLSVSDIETRIKELKEKKPLLK